MTRNTIMSHFSGQLMAFDRINGRNLLAMDWPSQPAASAFMPVAGLDLKMEAGERFAVVRGVAVMPLRGMLTPNSAALEKYMGWSTYAGIEAACDELAAADDVRAVIVEVDSPGGFVMGLAGAVAAFARLASVKPVYALANPLAASAAYAVASQATEISVTPGAIVGSVGVMREASAPIQPDMMGEQWSVHVSSHARAKWPNPQTDAGLAEIARSLDLAETEFHGFVAAGRGIAPDALLAALSVTDDPADGGAVFSPADAIARGLADTVETRAAFYNRVMAAHAPPPISKPSARAFMARARAAQAIAQT